MREGCRQFLRQSLSPSSGLADQAPLLVFMPASPLAAGLVARWTHSQMAEESGGKVLVWKEPLYGCAASCEREMGRDGGGTGWKERVRKQQRRDGWDSDGGEEWRATGEETQIRHLRWEGSQLVSYAGLTAGTGILSWPFYAREYQAPASHSRGMHWTFHSLEPSLHAAHGWHLDLRSGGTWCSPKDLTQRLQNPAFTRHWWCSF